jgi:hypothetical protein
MSTRLLNSFNFKWASTGRVSDYYPVPLTEKEDTGSIEGSETHYIVAYKRWTRRCPTLQQLVIAVLCAALFIITFLYVGLAIKTAPKQRQNCGSTIAEAHARGCTFDQLAKSWLPPACPRYGLDEYLSAGFAASNETGHQWRFYHDREHNHEISVDQLSLMAEEHGPGEKWWTSGREHMVHCTWMLIRIAHVLNTGQRRDELVSNFQHAKHCAIFMLDRALEIPGVDDIRVFGNTGFGHC